MLPEDVGERLEAFFLGHRGAGAFFRTEREVEVLEGGEVFGGVDFDLQLLGEELAFLERGEDRFAAFVEFLEFLHAVADVGDLDFVEFAGALLAVAGDERDGRAFFKKNGGRGDLAGLQGEFLDDLEEVFFDHGLVEVRFGVNSRVAEGGAGVSLSEP